jgi:DNA-binding SARP family transcriptional activator
MDFRVLGSLEVDGPRTQGSPAGAKERAVLARLLCDPGRSVTLDALLEAAWPGVSPEAAARSLAVRIAKLRSFLEPGRERGSQPALLVREGDAYRLDIDPEQVDAVRFERRVVEAGTLKPGAALERYESALALWRGAPYADLALAEFAQEEIRRLEELRRGALEGRARALVALGRAGEAVTDLQRLVAEDPLNENFVQTLMSALYAAGRQVEALAAYREFAERLAELGLHPMKETRELERRILTQEVPREEARPAAAPPRAPASTLPGRGAELGRLEAALADAAAGVRRLAMITGEPGSGKTALVEAFMAGRDVTTATGRCLEHRGPGEPYMPVLEALGALADGPAAGRVVEVLAQRAPTWLAELPWLLDADDLAALRERIGGATRERMLREIVEALESLAATDPLILVLEDLQWADPSTLELLAALARRSRPANLLLIGTFEPGPTAIERLTSELCVRSQCEEVKLSRLTEDAVREHLARRLPGTDVPEELAAAIADRSGGNPLYMRHLIDHWEGEGTLDGIPDSLRAYIREQVAALNEDGAEVMRAASVVGRRFAPGALAAALEMPEPAAEAVCDSLVRRTSLVEAREGGYAFTHDLLREVLYDHVPERRRTHLHSRIGAYLEEAYGSRAPDLAGELAHHFVEGRDPAGAVRFLRLAADRAFARSAHAEGVDHVRSALRAAERLSAGLARTREEVELLSQLGQGLVAVGGWSSPEAEEALLLARRLAGQLHDNEPLESVLLALATLYEVRGEFARAQEVTEEYTQLGPAERRLEVQDLLACNLFHQGSFARALEEAELGAELFASGDDSGGYSTFPATLGDNAGVACHDWAGLALWYLGYPDQALARAKRALELASDPVRSHSLATARAQLAVVHVARREPEAAIDWANATIEAATERGYAYRTAMGRVLRGWGLAARGDHDAGIEEISAGLAASRATGAHMDDPLYLGLLADAYLRAGELHAAAGTVEEALTIATRERSLFYEPELRRLAAEVRLAGDGEAGQASAETELTLALERARGQSSRSLELRAAETLARLRRTQGRAGEARGLVASVYEGFTEGFDTYDLREAAALLERHGKSAVRAP